MYLRASPGQFPWLRCRPEPGALPGDCLGRWVIGPLGEAKRKVDMVLRVHRVARGAKAPQSRRSVLQGQISAVLGASENPLKCPRREEIPGSETANSSYRMLPSKGS